MEQLLCMTKAKWRNWLVRNHESGEAIWLVFLKGGDTGQALSYAEALDEALCFGWIDSLIKRVDDRRYLRKFSRRREVSKWSEVNKAHVERLTREGRMERAGMAVVAAAKKNGSWDKPDRPEMGEELPPALKTALDKNAKANGYFETLAPSHQKKFLMWIASAKREKTVKKRVQEAIKLLEKGEKLGMK